MFNFKDVYLTDYYVVAGPFEKESGVKNCDLYLEDDYYIFDQEHLCLTGQNSNKRYTLGQKVKVECARADKDTKSVDFILKEPKKRKNNNRNSKKRWI